MIWAMFSLSSGPHKETLAVPSLGLVAGCVLASALLTLGGAATALAQQDKDESRGTTMADVHTLIDRNLEFANSFKQGDLTLLPRLSTLVLTCLDARVDPAHLFGLELGDAVVMCNIGGRVTDEVIEQIAILRGLDLIKLAPVDALTVLVVSGHFYELDDDRMREVVPARWLQKAAA